MNNLSNKAINVSLSLVYKDEQIEHAFSYVLANPDLQKEIALEGLEDVTNTLLLFAANSENNEQIFNVIEEKITPLSDKEISFKVDNDRIKAEIEEYQSKIAIAENDNNKLSAELNTHKDSHQSLLDKINENNTEKSAIENEIADSEALLSGIQTQLNTARENNALLKQKHDSLKQQLIDTQASDSRLIEDIAALNIQLVELPERKQALLAEKSSLENQIITLSDDVNNTQVDVENTSQRYELKKQDLADEMSNLAAIEKKLALSQCEYDQVSADIHSKTADFQKLQEQLVTFENKNTALLSWFSNQQDKLAELSNMLERDNNLSELDEWASEYRSVCDLTAEDNDILTKIANLMTNAALVKDRHNDIDNKKQECTARLEKLVMHYEAENEGQLVENEIKLDEIDTILTEASSKLNDIKQ